MEELKTEREKHWFDVGATTGLIAFSLIIFPVLMLLASTQWITLEWHKSVFLTLVVLPYCVIILAFLNKFITFCEKIALAMVKTKEK